MKWYPEVIDACPDAIIILGAAHISKRFDENVIAEFFKVKKKPITKQEGEYLAQYIAAHKYNEICTDNRIGICEIFDGAIKEFYKFKNSLIRPLPRLYPLFCKTGSVERLEDCLNLIKYNLDHVVGMKRSPFSLAIEGENYGFAKKILELENGIANLANSNLETIPKVIIDYVNSGLIREIILDNNQLNAIPNEFSVLRNVSIVDNPLFSIPQEFIGNLRWKKLRQYLLSVAEKTANWNIRKLLVVGEEGVGKSTLGKCLNSKSGKVDTIVNLSTDGIDIQDVVIRKISEKGEKEYIFSVWDFGGQMVFYPTHQFFLSMGAIYIVVFNFASFKLQRVEYWMKQLKQLHGERGSSVIIMVGTHADQCKEEDILTISEKLKTSFPKRLFPAFQGMVIPVSCKQGTGVKQLKELLTDLAEHPSVSPIVSQSWVNLYHVIHKYKTTNTDYVNWKTYHQWSVQCGVPSDQLSLLTEFLVNNGSVLHFDDKLDPSLKDLVILNPQWLARVMSCLITTKGNFVYEGFLSITDVRKIFTLYPDEIQAHLLSLLEKFKIIFHITLGSSTKILVPSLLPATRPTSEISKIFPSKLPIEQSTMGRIFNFGQLPLGLVGRLMISVLRIPSAKPLVFWRNGLIIDFTTYLKDGKLQKCKILLEYNFDEYTLEIQARFEHQYRNFTVSTWRKVVESIKTLMESFYPRLAEMMVEYIPCIHCYKQGVYKEKVFMFPYQDVYAAAQNGEHFVYCNNINSPYRAVFITDIAPDLGMADIPRLSEESIKIEKVIGEGGFGKVYRGTMLSLSIAVKELKFGEDLQDNTLKFQEFQTECYMMNLLQHQNIIKLYGILMNPPRMVLQYVDGGDLFKLLHPKKHPNGDLISISQNEFAWEKRYKIAMDIAKGLHYLQSLTPPVIHRDLRSPNIFMTKDGRAIIGDFGLARVVHTGQVGGILGTWQWVAPEAISSESEAYDQRSDIYSFGVILWELASISLPFEEYSKDPRYFANGVYKVIEIKSAIVNDNLRPTIPPDTPPLFANLIAECWDSDVNKRPDTCYILQTLSKLSNVYVDDVIEHRLVLPKKVFIGNMKQESMQRLIIQKSGKIPQPSDIIVIPENSREKFSCFVVKGSQIWAGSNLGSIFIFEPAGESFGLIMSKKAHNKRVSQILDLGDCLWSISDDGTATSWNSSTMEIEHQWMPFSDAKSPATTTLCFPPSSSIEYWKQRGIKLQVWFVSSVEGRITAWDINTRMYLKSITHEELLGAMAMEFHKGYVWITSGASGNKVCVYDAITFDHVGNFTAHDSRITSILSFGDRIWTSSVENIRVWEANSLETLSLYRTSAVQQSKIECMVANNDRRVVVGTFDGTVFSFDEELNALQELVTVDGVRNIGIFSSRKFVTLSQYQLSVWVNVDDFYELHSITNTVSFDAEDCVATFISGVDHSESGKLRESAKLRAPARVMKTKSS